MSDGSTLSAFVEGLLTVEQAAAALKVSKSTVHHLTCIGMLASFKIGRRVYYTEEDLLAYLISLRRPASSDRAAGSSGGVAVEPGR